MIGTRTIARSWLLLLLALPGSYALAAEYFVSPSGDDSKSGRSTSAAWRTIAKANSSVRAGDVVYLRGGQYLDDPIKPQVSGTTDNEILYTAWQNERPVLTSNRRVGLEVAVDLTGRSYITVDGIHVDGQRPYPNSTVKHFVHFHSGSFNTVRNSTFKYAYGWQGVQFKHGEHHSRLINNVLDFVGNYDDGGGDDTGDVIQIHSAQYNLVEGNTVSHGGHNLLQIKGGSYNIIRNNVFDNDYSALEGPGLGGRNLTLMGSRNLFEGNVVRNSGDSIDELGNAGMKTEGEGNIVRRNLIFSNANEGITTEVHSGSPRSRDNRIYHNTLYGNDGPAWGVTYFKAGDEIANNVFKNNIVFNNRRKSTHGNGDILLKLAQNPAGVLGRSLIEGNLVAKSRRGDAALELRNSGGVLNLDDAASRHADYVRANILDVPTFVSSDPKEASDFALAPGSRGIDEAVPLSHARSNGSGKVLPVDDAGYFTDGFTVELGDRIRVAGGPPIRVTKVDYAANRLTLAEATEWQKGAAITLDYHGDAPDIGAVEFEARVTAPKRPRPPATLSGTRR